MEKMNVTVAENKLRLGFEKNLELEMNHDPNSCESFDPLLTVCQKHDRHHSVFRDTYVQCNDSSGRFHTQPLGWGAGRDSDTGM